MSSNASNPALKLLLPVFCRFRLRLLLGFSALIAVDLLQLTVPRYLKTGVDALASGGATRQQLLTLCLFILMTAAAAAGMRFCWRTLLLGFSRHQETILRDDLYAHVLTMDQVFFDRHLPGDLMAHAGNDLTAVQMAFGMGMVAVADIVVMSAAALFFMCQISIDLTLLSTAPLPFLAAGTWFFSRLLHKRFEQAQRQFSLLTEFSRNTLISIRLIKSCTREAQQILNFERLDQEYASASLRSAVIQGLLTPFSLLAGGGGMLLVLYLGGGMVIRKEISLGDFVAFSTYFAMLAMPLNMIGWATGIVRRGLTSFSRIASLRAEQSSLAASIRQPASPAAILQSRPHLSLRHLCFAYPGTVHAALTDINLEIGPGVLGITGRTGSGKSTLCRLLTRQYPVADHAFFVAGHDVNRLGPELIRRLISFVGREPQLFSGTAAENISLARPEASLAEIMEAAALAAVHKEIMAMPEGYQTRIGEKGLRLSGGQKQRFAIARALLAARPVLIADDALSALDAETAQIVFASLRNRQRGKTLIFVSHHVQLLSHADHVLILENGRIAEQGSPDWLMARSSFYQETARQQQGREEANAQLRLC
jgi:ATP-binding cassette subfamily B protein